MELMEYIFPELIILIPTCWGIGLALKTAPVFHNDYIPIILLMISVILSMLWVFTSIDQPVMLGVFTGITQGVVAWLVAWIGHAKYMKKNGA